jgi:hypothetical protein
MKRRWPGEKAAFSDQLLAFSSIRVVRAFVALTPRKKLNAKS